MIVQNVQANGQPRDVSAVPKAGWGEVLHRLRAGFWQRGFFDIDETLKILGKAVDGLQPAFEKIRQYPFPFAFDLTGNDADGFVHEFLDVRLLLAEHVDRAAGVKSADDDLDVLPAQNSRHVQGAGELVCRTPTRQTSSFVPGSRPQRMIFLSGIFSAVSSKVVTSMGRSPKMRRSRTSSVNPCSTLSVLLGRTPFQKRIT